MQTQTHIFLALALFAKAGKPLRNRAVLAGAMATDLFIYLGFLWFVTIKGQSAQIFFRDTYFDPLMQFWSALSNSLPLYAALAIAAYAARARKWGEAVWVFALAGLTQAALDLPVHAEDAHRHFWPLSDFRFISPVSYWDPNHFGRIIGPLDAALGLLCIFIVWQKFPKLWVRIVLGVFAALYIVMIGAALIGRFPG